MNYWGFWFKHALAISLGDGTLIRYNHIELDRFVAIKTCPNLTNCYWTFKIKNGQIRLVFFTKSTYFLRITNLIKINQPISDINQANLDIILILF